MALTATPYGQYLLNLANGSNIDYTANTFKLALLTSSYTPNLDSHANFTAVSAAEISSANYTAGGLTLTGLSWTYDSTNDRAVLTCDAAEWTGITATARYAVFYKSTGTAGTSLLISLLDFGSDRTYTDEPVQIDFTDGIVRHKR